MKSPLAVLLLAAMLTLPGAAQSLADLGVDAPTEKFSQRVVTTSRLADPWEILWGPDGQLWATERSANAVIRVDPVSGAKTTLVTVPDAYRTDTQDGVLGLALHPGLLRNRGQDYVYVSFVYDGDPGPGHVRRLKVRRYTYDAQTRTLDRPLDLLSELPSFGDHAGGRLVMGPNDKLFLTVGDLAANHLSNPCTPNRAQDLPAADDVKQSVWTTYQGKVLRINLDGSIPADNPILGGVRSHVYSYGHRNPQGLAVGPGGRLYEMEHGPSTDDELNLIQAGKNYGWPYVAGYQDDRTYVYANWSAAAPTPCASLHFIPIGAPAGVPQQPESAWSHPDFTPPLKTFFTVGPTFNFAQGNAVIAPSGIEVYAATGAGAIPGWSNSVLITSLTKGSIFRVKLNADGTAVVGNPVQYFQARSRYRDLAVSPDGRTIFVAVDNWSSPENPGAILAFSLAGS
jgi:PQQ-dependent dehydrogenase (s-GDH family)